MAIWWLKVAEEIAALRKAEVERPEAYVPDMFSQNGPAIETTYRVVPAKPAALAATAVPEPPRPESRFHSEGRLFNTGRGESSFLAEGRRRKSNIRSWS